MTFAVLRNEEPDPDAEAESVDANASATLRELKSAAARADGLVRAGGGPLLAAALVRLVDATVAAEELRDRAAQLRDARADGAAIAAAADAAGYERGLAAAASRRLAAVPR